MNCEQVELALLEPELSAEVQAHLTTCASCQAFQRDLGLVSALAALPAPSTAERAALDGLPEATWTEWRKRQRSRQSWLGYAAAAGFGALIATAGFWTARPVREVIVERVVERPAVQLATAEINEPNLSADDVFFEVTWPELPEGEDP